ncbi:peptidoglycan-binding protein [Streptomyces sp. NPDC058665]|uniref:peptidoglycan-binding domain-containing protein n=1 Tax=Streptomyces sp. NPDC058665 TaxID=3346586 RepID=UPI0036581A9D
MTGQLCPECGTPRDAYGRPGAGCDCSERAAIAAAEDFDPLRIRPYVPLREPDGAVPSIPPPPPPEFGDRSEGNDPAETMRLVLPGLRTTGPRPTGDPERKGGRRTFAMVALAAAAVAVIGTASFAGGLFTGDDGSDEATSDLNSGLPTASARPDPSESESAPASASASASKSSSASGSASASAPASASSGAPESAEGGPPAPSTKPAATGRPPANPPQQGGAGTQDSGAGAALRRGDSGAEVEELQRRLSEVWLYNGGYDGQFGERVEGAVRIYQSYKSIEGDPSGVYGENTRRALEAETSGKGREQGGDGGGGGRPGHGDGWGRD